MKTFLGGTCAGPDYRKELIPFLKEANVDFFNPVVDDWTEDCIAEEERQKRDECDVHLYILTPYMEGCYSVAEIMTSCLGEWANKKTVIFSFLKTYKEKEFNEKQIKSLNAVGKMVEESGHFWIIEPSFNQFAKAFEYYEKHLT